MPRTRRILPGGMCYHVINRGNGGARVFHDPADYHAFVQILAEASQRIPMRVLAACLMPNHFHFVVHPLEDGEVSAWMHWLMTAQTVRHRRKHGTIGHIWQGRFKPFMIQHDAHLLAVMRYVERNALRAGLVARAEAWRWGSLAWRQQRRPPLALAPCPVALPTDWVARVNEAHTSAELEALRRCVNRGLPFGDSDWARAEGGLSQKRRSSNVPNQPF